MTDIEQGKDYELDDFDSDLASEKNNLVIYGMDKEPLEK